MKEDHTALVSSKSSSTPCSSNNSSIEKSSSKLNENILTNKLSVNENDQNDAKTEGKCSSLESINIEDRKDSLIHKQKKLAEITPSNTIDRELKAIDRQMADLAQECQQLENQKVSVYKVEHGIHHGTVNTKIEAMLDDLNFNTNSKSAPISNRPALRPPMTLPSFNGTDSDHIYESIPDITESDEPIYCLPYEPGKTGKRISPNNSVNQTNITNQKERPKMIERSISDPRGTRSSKSSTSSGGSRGSNHGSSDRKRSSFRDGSSKPRSSEREGGDRKKSVEQWVEQNTSIIHSCNCKEENRDSSSAYNTGDSTGSNHQVYLNRISIQFIYYMNK